MGWVLLLLLGANALFLAWQLHERAQPPAPLLLPTVSNAAEINRLLLLSELEPGELRVRAPVRGDATAGAAGAGASVSEAGTNPPLASRTCFSIGPVQPGDEVARMAEWLEAQGASVALRADERRELALYWVFFPAFETREAAQARTREMLEKGIGDIFIIKRGDMANAISLGVYSRKLSLERRLTELRRLGYEPGVVPRYRQKKATWYDAQFPSAEFDFPADRFSLKFPAAQVQEAACPQVTALKASGLSDVSRGGGPVSTEDNDRG